MWVFYGSLDVFRLIFKIFRFFRTLCTPAHTPFWSEKFENNQKHKKLWKSRFYLKWCVSMWWNQSKHKKKSTFRWLEVVQLESLQNFHPPNLIFIFFDFWVFLDPPTVILWFEKWRFWRKIAIFHDFLDFLVSTRRGNFFLALVTDQKWVCGSFNAIIVQIGRKKKKLHRFSCFLSSLGFRSKISPKICEKW